MSINARELRAHQRRITEGDATAECLIGVLASISAEMKPPQRRVCSTCGGLTARSKCDVCHALELVYLIEEVEFLLGTDRPRNIARRLGYANPESLANRLRRNGRTDLAGHFWRTKSDGEAA